MSKAKAKPSRDVSGFALAFSLIALFVALISFGVGGPPGPAGIQGQRGMSGYDGAKGDPAELSFPHLCRTINSNKEFPCRPVKD